MFNPVTYSYLCFDCPVHKNMHWRVHGLGDTIPPFLTTLQFSSALSNNWGTGLPCPCPSWIYCTGQQCQASLFPCLFFCLSFLCSQLLHHGSNLSFTQVSHPSTLAPLCHLSCRMLTAFFASFCLPLLGHVECLCSPHSAADFHVSV